MNSDSYFRPPGLGPDCSTSRSARLRERRFRMGCEARTEPPGYARLAERARQILLETEPRDPAMARARALREVVERCEITIEPDTVLLGGENPFFFNLMLPALQADAHARVGQTPPDEESGRLRAAGMYLASCFEGHITPGLEYILGAGVAGLRGRIEEMLRASRAAGSPDPAKERFWESALYSCESVLVYARRCRAEAERLARTLGDDVAQPPPAGRATGEGACAPAERAFAAELRAAAEVLSRVPEHPARTLHEALQSYWIAYVLATLEMGGCCPGGGIGLGRLDQFLHPFYARDIREGRLTRAQALELMELFLLCFRHVDYYTPHQIYTPGSQASLGGVTPDGRDASNDLTELIMEASLRIAMPAPYISLRLHGAAPGRYWQAAANYIAGGLGFPVVNDKALVPAFLRHGRTLEDARDYICSCCYENTIPGREAFHPNAAYLNLALVLELALNEGRSLLTGERLGAAAAPLEEMGDFEAILAAFRDQLHCVADRLVALVNHYDASHVARRRYPLMSVLMKDCIERGQDVCAGGARYNPTGCIVSGVPNVVNSLAAVRECVFERRLMSAAELREALRADFAGHEDVRRRLLRARKWGNGDDRVDDLAAAVTSALRAEFVERRNPRGGPWQLALYSFLANHQLGRFVGASADGRRARESLTRNLNPAWGTDRNGPTAILRSLSHIDFTGFPNGSSLDLRFSPAFLRAPEGRAAFANFLRAFVELGVMEMQITMVDTDTLLDAQKHPDRHPHLMVKVAGFSARFVDLSAQEQEEIIRRSEQPMGTAEGRL
jgi:formate C-acetyltransferase